MLIDSDSGRFCDFVLAMINDHTSWLWLSLPPSSKEKVKRAVYICMHSLYSRGVNKTLGRLIDDGAGGRDPGSIFS